MAEIKTGLPAATVGLLTDVDTTQRNPLGMITQSTSGSEFIYLQGVASTAAGDWVTYTGDYTTARLISTSPASGQVAVAMAATVASTYGWYQISGLTPTYTNLETDVSGDKKALYQMGTAGRASTTTTGATKIILRAFAVGNPASNTGQALINRPCVMGTSTI